MNQLQQPEQTSQNPQQTFRWRPGAVILGVGAVCELAVWRLLSPDRTMQVFASLPVIFGTLGLLVTWWFRWSGLSRRAKWTGAAVVGGLCLIGAALFRLEGFEGAMIPQWTWRWSPSTDKLPDSYWRSLQVSNSPNKPVVPSQQLTVTEADWPGFRGPRRNGVVVGTKLRTDWNQRPPELLWRHAVGLGWSSFAVVDGLAFTQEQRKDKEVVVCYKFDTGRQVWTHADTCRFSEILGGDGPRATPTVFDSRVYALGATGILNCLNAVDGRLLWSRNILKDAHAKNLMWGMAGSPLIYKNKVIVVPGGKHGRQVIAYDCKTGEIVWSGGSHSAGYAAPRVETVNGVTELLVFGGEGLSGFDPETGRELWFISWPTNEGINAVQPILYRQKAIMISSGYGRGAALFDIEWPKGERFWRPRQPPRWRSRRLKLKFNGAVLKGDYVYGLDEGILTCLDMRTGKRMWKGGRFGYGQLLLVGDVLLVQAESGEVVLVEATPKRFQKLAQLTALHGKTWNHPVLCRGRLLVRNAEEAACFSVE